jgi:hypothetical protein
MGTVQTMLCDESDFCGWDFSQGGRRCVHSVEDGCGAEVLARACDGGNLITCFRGQVTITQCADCDLACELSPRGAACR